MDGVREEGGKGGRDLEEERVRKGDQRKRIITPIEIRKEQQWVWAQLSLD